MSGAGRYGPKAAFVTAATAVALHRGGMRLCGDRLAVLAGTIGLEPCPAALRSAHDAAGGIIAARNSADDPGFDEARLRLALAMSEYWAGKALEIGREG